MVLPGLQKAAAERFDEGFKTLTEAQAIPVGDEI